MLNQHPFLSEHISAHDWHSTPEAVKHLVEMLVANISSAENESRLVQFLDATPLGIAVHNALGQIVYINQVGRDLLGVHRSVDLIPEDLTETFKIYRYGTSDPYPVDELPSTRALAGETTQADDIEIHQGDRTIPLEVKATPIFGDDDQVVYAIATFQDISERKRLEAERQRRTVERSIVENTLRQRENRYRQVIQAQTDLVLRSRSDTTITFANDAVCRALGLPLNQVLGKRWSSFVPPDDIEEITRKIAALTLDHPTFENINQDQRANGAIGWTQWVNLGIFDAQGTLLEIQSVGRDVTELQEQILREQALNRVLQAIRNSLDLDMIFATATAEASHLLQGLDCYVVQYFPKQHVWRYVAEFRHRSDRPPITGFEILDVNNPFAAQLKQFQRVLVDDTIHLDDPINAEIAAHFPGAWLLIPLIVDGKLWGSLTLMTEEHPFTWQPEHVEPAQAIANQLEVAIHQANLYRQVQIELAERRRVEAALRESEARFQNMATNVPGAIFQYLLRPDGSDSVLYMSPGCYRLWEVDAADVIADASLLWRVIHPDDLPGMQASVMESAQTLQPWSHAWRITTPSGQEKWLEAAGRPTRQSNGDIVWDTLILDVTERKQAEYRFQALAANTPGVIYQYVLHPDGSHSMLYVSPGCRDLWELEPQDIIEDVERVWQMVNPEDLPAMRASVLESAQTLESWNYEWQITTPSGQQKWLQASARPQRHANGDLVWDGLILDVSDRKRAEEALTASEQYLRTIIENEPECVKILDTRGNILDMNPAGLKMLEADTPEQIIGRQVKSRILSEHYPAFQALHQRVLQGETGQLEFMIVGLKGTRRWVDSRAVPLRNEQGDIVSILAITRDITESKRAELALAESEQRLSTLISNLPGYVYHVQNDLDYTPLFISQGVEAVTGYRPDEYLVERSISCGKEMHPDDVQLVWNKVQKAISDHLPYECEYRIITKTGQEKWVWERGRGIYAEDGSLQWLEGFVTDISDRKAADAAMHESEARYRLLAENMNDLVCLHDSDGRYAYVSPSCESLLGYRYDDLLGRSPYALIHPEDRDRVYQEVQTVAIGGKSIPITYRVRQRSGSYIWFETLIKPITDASGQIMQLQTTSRDVTERIQVQQQLQHAAVHDELTGLPNRHLLMERVELAINRAKRLNNYRFAVLFLDLDRFKVINDSLGHLAGDQLLVAIAQRLKETLRGIDLAARLGGDEFVVLLEEVEDIQEVIHATERIFAELKVPLLLEGREVYITPSIGIVLGTKNYTQASDLLRDADIAMYRAKSNGKARYEIFDAAMHAKALARLHLENDLRRAIECREFVLHYQPIVALDSRMLIGFEALIRWQHPTKGLKFPDTFITVAEETGLITEIDRWALQTACRQLAAWNTAFPNLPNMRVGVNLTAQDLRSSGLLNDVKQTLTETQLDGHCLVLEITESMLIEDIEFTIDLLNQLKREGVQLSIDDFGTGYSSLSYLHRLPVDHLKIDRSFVNQMQEGQRNHQIVKTIAALSNPLEIDVIAEGIETPQQLEQLQHLGYKFGQGYLFAKPLTANAVEALLRRGNLCLFP